jgi:hypothetical protein
LGHKSIRDCQQHITSAEFAEWLAYYSIEPFGDDLLDRQMAQLEALMANIHRDPKKGRSFKPDDFALRQDPGSRMEEQDVEELTPGQIYQRLKRRLGL